MQQQQQNQQKDDKDLQWLKQNSREFMNLQAEEKRRILGNLMYFRIRNNADCDGTLTPKVTGMLIDLEVLDLADIISILEDDSILKERVSDAVTIIKEGEDDI